MSVRVLRRVSPLFVALWLFVIFVSVFDGYLAVRFRDQQHKYQINPVGRLFIQHNGGQVRLRVAAKNAGTVAAATQVLLN